MKKMICFMLVLLSVLQYPLFASAEHERFINSGSGEDPFSSVPTDIKATDMTLMIYMCGSTLEDSTARGPGGASADLREICESGFNSQHTNVIIYAGGCEYWVAPEIHNGACGVYRISNGRISLLEYDGNLYNMGDPSTLSAFLRYGYEEYPAKHYALILWDHGGGSNSGICHDINFHNDTLSMSELDAALKDSPFSQTRLDWIGFDACLMSALETAKVVAPYAAYMVASEETELIEGWDYSFLREMDRDQSPTETGERIVESYYRTMSMIHPNHNNTIACIDLSKISSVFSAISDYFRDFTVDRGTYRELSRMRREFVSFGGSGGFDLVDLDDMMHRLSRSKIVSAGDENRIYNALDACVIANQANQGEGLSIYFPYDNMTDFPETISQYREMHYSEEYADFINRFGSYRAAGSHVTSDSDHTEESNEEINEEITAGSGLWSDLVTMNEQVRDTRSIFKLKLSDEQADEYCAARFLAFQKADMKDAWRLAALSDKVEVQEGGILTGEYTYINLFVLNPDREPIYETPLSYTVRKDGLYEIAAVLVDADGEQYDARLVFAADDSTYGVSTDSVDVYLYDAAVGTFFPRMSADLTDYAEVLFTVEGRGLTRDSNGAILPFEAWPSVGEPTVCSWKPGTNETLGFLKDRVDEKSLSVAFEITDIFNNVYLSSLQPLSGSVNQGGFLLTYDDGKEQGRAAMIELSDDAGIDELWEDGVLFHVSVTNLSEAESVISVKNVQVNGEDFDITAEVYGLGENGGLIQNETEELSFLIEIAGGKAAIESINFTLSMIGEANEPFETEVTALLPDYD